MYRNIKNTSHMCKYINIFYINTLLIHKKVFYIYKISIKSKRRNIVLVDVDWWLGCSVPSKLGTSKNK